MLQFQHAKLKFEQALTAAGDITYSIVRPNAYFKSVSGQLELLQQGTEGLGRERCSRKNHTTIPTA